MAHAAVPLKSSSLQRPVSPHKGRLHHRQAEQPAVSVGRRLACHRACHILLLFAALSLSLGLCRSLSGLVSTSHAHSTLSVLLPYFHIVSLSAHTHKHVHHQVENELVK